MRQSVWNLFNYLNRKVTCYVMTIAFSILLSLPFTGVAVAQDFDQPVVLISPQPDAPIPIAIRPAPNQPITGYGINGKAITVMEQVGDYMDFDDPSATWCHIRLEEKPYTEGWIQGKFVAISPIPEER